MPAVRQAGDSPLPETHTHRELERRARWYWALALSVLVLTTLGLTAGLFGTLQREGSGLWPFRGSEFLLLGSFVLTITLFVTYLALQHRLVSRLRTELSRNQEQARRQTERHYDRLIALSSVSQTMADKTGPQEVFDHISKICFDTFECDQISVMLLDRDTETLSIRSALGHADPAVVDGVQIRVGEGVAGWVAEHKTPLLLGANISTGQFRDYQPKKALLSAAMVVPILLREELVGVLNVSQQAPGSVYNHEDLRALTVFSWNVAISLRHAEQAGWMRETIRTLQEPLPGSPPADPVHGTRKAA